MISKIKQAEHSKIKQAEELLRDSKAEPQVCLWQTAPVVCKRGTLPAVNNRSAFRCEMVQNDTEDDNIPCKQSKEAPAPGASFCSITDTCIIERCLQINGGFQILLPVSGDSVNQFFQPEPEFCDIRVRCSRDAAFVGVYRVIVEAVPASGIPVFLIVILCEIL